jgi:hypothetical protein
MPLARSLALLLTAVLVLGPAAVLAGAPPTAAAAAAAKPRPAASNEARIGGRGFGRAGRGGIFGRSRRPSVRRPAVRRPVNRRPLFRHGFFGSVLRALGVAYLVHMLFGWGPGGGSPFGLLIVLGVVLWLATRRRRRRPAYDW